MSLRIGYPAAPQGIEAELSQKSLYVRAAELLLISFAEVYGGRFRTEDSTTLQLSEGE